MNECETQKNMDIEVVQKKSRFVSFQKEPLSDGLVSTGLQRINICMGQWNHSSEHVNMVTEQHHHTGVKHIGAYAHVFKTGIGCTILLIQFRNRNDKGIQQIPLRIPQRPKFSALHIYMVYTDGASNPFTPMPNYKYCPFCAVL